MTAFSLLSVLFAEGDTALQFCAPDLIKKLPSNRPLASRNQRVVTWISAANVASRCPTDTNFGSGVV